MHAYLKIWLNLVLALVLITLAGCSHAPYTGRNQMIFLESDTELALGASAAKEILAAEPIDTTSKYAQTVSRVGKRIAAVAEKPEYAWEFHTISKDVLNAFCLPGGKIFVYTGLFKAAKSDAQLAAVIGHEIGHALARHGAERYSMQMMAQAGQLGAAITLGGEGASGESQAILGAFGLGLNLGVLLPYSRTHEYEADHIGLLLMAKAGYHPEEALTFWQNMEKEGGASPPEFLSTHPTGTNRIQTLQKLLPEAMQYYRPEEP